jgi:hypothetical protein
MPKKNTITKIQPTFEEISKALWSTGGLLKHSAVQLGCNIEELKDAIKKSKKLRELLFTVRETCLDEVEKTLYTRITGDGDVARIKDGSGILTMFYLKCLGKHRGWIDRPDKAGETSKKPIYIKILPVGGEVEEKKVGRPKKLYAEAKVLPSPSQTQEEKDLEDIIEGEVLD